MANPLKKTGKPLRARNATLRSEQERKRNEAQTRQAAWDALTPQQRLDKLDRGGFRAQKQRERLQALINKPAPVAQEAPAATQEPTPAPKKPRKPPRKAGA